MARKKKNKVLSTLFTIIVVIAVIWMKFKETTSDKESEEGFSSDNVESTLSNDQSDAGNGMLTSVSLSSSKFQVIEGCSLIDHRGNDGDSFHVNTPKGKEEVRLYYVDAPESAARTYRNGDTNHKRIAQQGDAMGGLNRSETTQVGVDAKAFVKELLNGKKFSIATTREKVYGSRRIYAYVIVKWKGQQRYLHELLVANGLGRIHTKPMTLPDNTSSSRHKQHLRKLEEQAKSKNYGAWKLR